MVLRMPCKLNQIVSGLVPSHVRYDCEHETCHGLSSEKTATWSSVGPAYPSHLRVVHRWRKVSHAGGLLNASSQAFLR